MPRERHLEQRHIGHRGGIIPPHRSILTLRIGSARFFFTFGVALGLCTAWVLLMDSVMRGWATAFDQLAVWLSIPAESALREDSLFGGRWQLLLPRIELASAEPTRAEWWWGMAITAVALVASYVLPRRHLPLLYWLRLVALVQGSAQLFFWLFPGAFPYRIGGYTEVLLIAGAFVIAITPWIYALTYSVLAVSAHRILGLNVLAMAHLIVFVPLQIMAHAWIIHHASVLWMPLVFWMFGLALDVGILIALYGWAVSWRPAKQQPRQLSRPGFTASMALLLVGGLWAGEVRAQAVVHGAEFATSYGRYTEDLGTLNSQSLALWRSRQGVDRWRFDVGRAERFGEEGVGFGLSYARTVGSNVLSAGVSTGTGDVLFPRWRVDLGAQRTGLGIDRLTANVGYTHVQSKAENSADGVGVGLRLGLGGPWSASVDGRIDVGQPGDTVSESIGLGLQFGLYRRLYLDAGVRFGEVSYLLVEPGEAQIDFSSRSLELGGAVYVDPQTAVSLRLQLSDTEIYDLWALRLGLVREW